MVGVSIGDYSDTAEKTRALGASFSQVHADFATLTQTDGADVVARIVATTGRLDVLVNNSGIIKHASAVEFPESDWNTVLQINLTAPFFLCQAFAKWWLSGGSEQSSADARLKIVDITSMLSFQDGILMPAYNACKSGIACVTKALAGEWPKERININTIAPGYIATENTRPLREDEIRNHAILARSPDDITGNRLFLSSPEADYMNDTIMNVDGG